MKVVFSITIGGYYEVVGSEKDIRYLQIELKDKIEDLIDDFADEHGFEVQNDYLRIEIDEEVMEDE